MNFDESLAKLRRNNYFRGMRFIASLIMVFTAFSFAAQGQSTDDTGHRRNKPADAAELDAIAKRGRAIAAYDAAAWHASDAVEALHPPANVVNMFIGRRTADGWVMGFGRLNEAKDAFLLAYEAIPTADVKHPSVEVDEPKIEDKDVWLHEARAFEIVRETLGAMPRPYNIAILPTAGGDWFVYAYPAQTVADAFPSGGDTRYTVSSDGTKIKETHRMHASIMEFKTDKDKTVQMTYRTAFLYDAPEDTDVAGVLMMEPHVPMLVATKKFVYRISADGTPSYIAPTDIFLKDAHK
jgi:hypothetical protein